MPVSATFSCGHCGKGFPWKASIAGKKARCSCGQILTVPQSPPAAPDDADLYDLADPPPVAAAPLELPPPPRQTLAYASPVREHVSADALTHPPRDIYFPTGLLIAGFLATCVWGLVKLDVSPGALAIVSLFAGFITLVKTALLIAFALVAAPRLGVSFGTLRTAILKFAAIIIFTDAALLWLDVIMQATGAISASGRLYLRDAGVRLLCAATIMTLLCRFLFDMDRDETAMIAFPLAFLSRVIGFILELLLVAVLSVLLTRTPGAVSAPATTMPSPAAASANTPGPPAAGSAADQAIVQRIGKSTFIREGRDDLARRPTRIRGHRELVDTAYAAGAKTVYFDLEGGRQFQPAKAYIELPANLTARSASFTLLTSICKEYKFELDPQSATDTGQRYLTINFK